MPYLNRRRRKALHRASNWVVHLFAGPGSHKAFKRLGSQDTVVVELDICRSRSQDLYYDPLWRLLVKVAKLGRVAAVIGGPPSRTWSVKGHRADGPHPLRSSTEPFGLGALTSDERDLVDRHTGLCARMMWLHALSTAGRRVHHNPSDGTSMVAFMLEQPQSVEQHVVPGDCAVSSAPSFWNTTLWQTYADEAGLFEVRFRQGPLGHAGEKPTTVGTNLPDLRDLQGLQGDALQGCCSADSRVSPVWARVCSSHRVRTPRLAVLSPHEVHPSRLGTACGKQSRAISPRLCSLRSRCRKRPPPPRCSSPGCVLHVS